MASSNDTAVRFNRIKDHLASLTKWAAVSEADSTVVVDVGELELQMGRYQEHLDTLLNIEPTPSNRERLSTTLADLWASVHSIKMVCDDLEGPLDRLMGVVCPEDDEVEGEDDR